MKNFFKTVAMVTVFSICEKFLGFLYRVYLSRTIGTEGVGLYQVALSVFAFLLTITCSGTPITVSRLMTKYKSENRPDKVRKVITAGILYTLIVAVILCLIFFLLGDNLHFIFADKRCSAIFYVVLPGLIFTSVYSVLRGVFWGNKDFLPYSVIELLEEICMIIMGILLIERATNSYSGAFRAGLAVTISYVFSFTLATAVFFIRKNKLVNPQSELKTLLKASTPVSAMRTANSLSVSLVSVILPIRLVASGLSNGEALSLYGAAVGEAMPLLFIPSTLIGSFTLVLVPEISEHFYSKNNVALKNDIEKALKFTTVLSACFIPLFLVCGKEIGLLIFNSPECGRYLTVSAFLVLFIGLSGLTSSILDSIGKEKHVLAFCLIGGVLMLASAFLLPSVLGIYALTVGSIFIYGLTTLLNVITIFKCCKNKPRYLRFLITSILIVIPTVILGLMLEKMLLPLLGTLITFLVVSTIIVAFYGLLSIGFGLIELDFIKEKILSIFKRNNKKSKIKTCI